MLLFKILQWPDFNTSRGDSNQKIQKWWILFNEKHKGLMFAHLNIVRTDVDLALLAPVRRRVHHHPALRPHQLVGQPQCHNLVGDNERYISDNIWRNVTLWWMSGNLMGDRVVTKNIESCRLDQKYETFLGQKTRRKVSECPDIDFQ